MKVLKFLKGSKEGFETISSLKREALKERCYNASTATFWQSATMATINWAVNSTVAFINKGWRVNSSGGLDWWLDESKGEWTEVWMDVGIGALKGGLSFVFEGNYTGYGAKQRESLLAFALSKGLDMYRYSLYQQGTFGSALQQKYAGRNAFDLAGGLDLTLLQVEGGGAASLRILSTGLDLHSGAGEFGGFGWSIAANGTVSWNMQRTWAVTMNNFRDIGQGIGSVFNAVGSGIAWLANEIGNAFGNKNRTYYDDNLGSNLERWKEKETIILNYNLLSGLNKFKIGTEINISDPVLEEIFKYKIERRKYFNENAPETAELWQKAKQGDEQALKELFGQFVQSVTEKEDAADKTQRMINKIMEDAEKGKFGMGISGDKAKELLDILKGGDNTDNNKKFDKFVKEMSKNKDREEIERVKTYLNGLKYMYDNKDVAAVYIMSKSCAIISDYLLAGLTGKLDPTKVSYEDFYKTKFEQGWIGSPYSYREAPVWNRKFGWENNDPFIAGLNYRATIGDKQIFAYMRPDLYGKDKNIAIEHPGITTEEWEKMKTDLAYKDVFSKKGIEEFNDRLNDLYNSIGNIEWYIVQRKRDYNDTHFFIMKRTGNEFKLYDHNWLFSPYAWSSSYNRDNHYISRYIWYK